MTAQTGNNKNLTMIAKKLTEAGYYTAQVGKCACFSRFFRPGFRADTETPLGAWGAAQGIRVSSATSTRPTAAASTPRSASSAAARITSASATAAVHDHLSVCKRPFSPGGAVLNRWRHGREQDPLRRRPAPRLPVRQRLGYAKVQLPGPLHAVRRGLSDGRRRECSPFASQLPHIMPSKHQRQRLKAWADCCRD